MKAGWPTKTLAEVCQIKPPKSEAYRKVSKSDLVSFAPMEDLGIDQKFLVATKSKPLASVAGSYTYFADGDVLLAKITPCFENGKLGIAADLTNGIGFGSSEYIVFRPDPSLDKEWLYYFLSRESFRLEGAGRMSGAVGHKRVSKDFIEAYPILVPPLPEQQRIVGILDAVFDGIAAVKANAEKNLQNVCAFFESHLQAVYTEQRGEWVNKPLKDFCSFENGDRGTNYPSKSARTTTGIPFINAGHLTKDGIDLNSMDYISRERYDLLSNGKIRPQDILFCLRGSLGKFASVGDLSEGAIASSLVIVRPEQSVLSDYLLAYFRSPLCAKMINRYKNGAAQPNLSAKSLGQFVVPVPPFSLQKTIVDELKELHVETQRLESLYQRKLAALDALKKSLLHQAFTGQL